MRGVLARLAYFAQLRAGVGYDHWGMAKAYGDNAAQAAIAANHSRVFLEAVCEPLSELASEVTAAETGCDEQSDALALLRANERAAVPADLRGATASHLSFVLESLSLLERNSRASNRRAA